MTNVYNQMQKNNNPKQAVGSYVYFIKEFVLKESKNLQKSKAKDKDKDLGPRPRSKIYKTKDIQKLIPQNNDTLPSKSP